MEATPSITMLETAALTPSTTAIQKMRRSHFDLKQLDELAVSIKSSGMQLPIIARRSQANGRKDRFDIVAGERRWLGAKKAGLDQVPVIVRDLSDDQVLEIQLIENLQRSELHPLEEAQGFDELMKLKKLAPDALAEEIGRSRSYIDRRMRLLNLCPEARTAFFAGELNASVALLVARIAHHDTQREALKPIIKGRWQGQGPMSHKEALDFIASEFMLRLKDAPFDVNDEKLVPAAGSCQACPKRTGNQKELFSDIKGTDICTDPKCFDQKRQAIYFVAVKDLQSKGKKVLYGDSAKKVFPHWKNGSSAMSQDYADLKSTEYVGGRSQKISALLGPDYEPILVQHPASGQIIEVATRQAVAKATKDPKAAKRAARAARSSKPQGPDVDQMLLHRLVKMVGDNSPKSFGKAMQLDAIGRILSHVSTRDDELAAISEYHGWPKSWRGSSWGSAKLPKPAAKMDERKLNVLLWQILFTITRYQGQGRKSLLALFNIDEAKVREQIIAERKAAREKK